MTLIVFVALVALVGQDAAVSRDCLDDNHVNRCDDGRRNETLARFSAPTIEADAGSGAEIYRVLMVDGYGQDLPVIAFERRPGFPPQAVVYAANGRKMTANISLELWGRAQRELRFADQAVTPEAPAVDGRAMPAICLHSWVSTVEMANSYLDRSRRVPVRRRTEDACTAGLTTQSAFGLMALAMEAFPQCEALNEQQYRSAANRLGACAALEGDIPAAAEVRNTLNTLERTRTGEATPNFWRRYTGVNAAPTVTWDGETVVGSLHGREVGEFLASRIETHGARLVPETVMGMNAREVQVTGVLRRGDTGATIGAYSQTWEFSHYAHNWTLKTMTVTTGAQPAN